MKIIIVIVIGLLIMISTGAFLLLVGSIFRNRMEKKYPPEPNNVPAKYLEQEEYKGVV